MLLIEQILPQLNIYHPTNPIRRQEPQHPQNHTMRVNPLQMPQSLRHRQPRPIIQVKPQEVDRSGHELDYHG